MRLSLLLLALLPSAAAARQSTQPAGPPAGSCGRVSGLPSLSVTDDDGLTWATNRRRLALGQATFGLAALESGDWVAEFQGVLYVSRSGGCRWARLADGPDVPLRIAAGDGAEALAWGFIAAPQAWRIDTSAHGPAVVQPLPDLPTGVLALAADPADGTHLRAVAEDGGIYDLRAGDTRWSQVGRTAPVSFIVYFAAIDPADIDHVVVGIVSDGVVTTFDAGDTWTSAIGLSSTGGPVNAFNGVVSPADSDVVWVMGLDLDESGSGANGRHVYRSEDGGLTFVPVVDGGPGIVLTNGPVLAPHPTDAGVLYFPFGSRFEGGVWLYRYDHATGATGANFSSGRFQIRSMVVDPAQPERVVAGFEG